MGLRLLYLPNMFLTSIQIVLVGKRKVGVEGKGRRGGGEGKKQNKRERAENRLIKVLNKHLLAA